MKVAFIGLGRMGGPMARNLLRSGHELTVFNRTREKAQTLAADGARIADSPAGAAREAEVAVTMLANDEALERVVFDSDGILSGLRAGAIHMGASTISAALSRRLAEAHRTRQQEYVATPVLGRPDSAEARWLWVLAAGAPGAVEHCSPLIQSLGRGSSVVGEEPWRANVVKLSVNFMLAAMLEALGEAFTLVRRCGIDAFQFLEILNGGIFNSPVYENYGRIIAGRKFDPAGFQLRLGLKDIKLALAAGEEAEVPLPLASLIRDHMIAAIGNGHGDQDWSAFAGG